MDYQFLDYGNGRRLEQFGAKKIDRVLVEGEFFGKKQSRGVWETAEAYFQRIGRKNIGWQIGEDEFWQMKLEGKLKCELRLASHNQVGIFPEQLVNWEFIARNLKKSIKTEQVLISPPNQKSFMGDKFTVKNPIKVLNGFAYTGIATIYAAGVGSQVSVCHLDGSKPAINWAKKNAEISGKLNSQVRWIEDDVLTFMRREVKRGNKYDGIILDPPAFGRGKKGEWKIERDLDELILLMGKLLVESPSFVVLSCHAEGLTKYDLAKKLQKIKQIAGSKIEVLDLEISAENRKPIKMGACARWGKVK